MAEDGNAEAQFTIGYLYFTECDEVSAEAARHWLTKAAEQDHPEACYWLGDFAAPTEFAQGLSDSARVAFLIRPGELGSVQAQYVLGALYATGDWPGPKDDFEAVKWYTKAPPR